MLLVTFGSMRQLFFLIAFLTPYHCLFAQDVRIIQLKDLPAKYLPKSFYISAVADSTHDSTGIGAITDGGRVQYIVLQDGTATAIKSYFAKDVSADTNTQAVTLKIKKLAVDVKKKGAKWGIKMSATFVFSTESLNLELTSGDYGETNGEPSDYVESHIRKLVDGKLEQFEKWWLENMDKFATSSTVKVNVTLSSTSDKKNLIVYSLKKPLKQEDFQGNVRKDVPEKAMTMSGNFFASSTEIQRGQTVFNIVVTPYFDRSESWFNTENTNPNLLPHEQAHFDITAIKTCELVTALRTASFTKSNYLALFEELRKKYLDEMDAEQDAYDTETQHGTIPDKQQAWQEKISREVRAAGCY